MISTYIHSLVPSKTIPDSRPKWGKCIPVFRPNGPKTLPNGAANTYMAYIRLYPPPRHYINYVQVEKLLKDVNASKSGGHNMLPPRLIKASAAAIAAIANIFNASIAQGCYQSLKASFTQRFGVNFTK